MLLLVINSLWGQIGDNMKFIPILPKKKLEGHMVHIFKATMKTACSFLVSQSHIFSQINFGLDTVYRDRIYHWHLEDHFTDDYSARIYLDPIGTSFIKGLVHPDDIIKLTACVLDHILKTNEIFDKFFFLDFPFSEKFKSFNSIDNIFRYNLIVQTKILEFLDANPRFASRFLYILHFRSPELFEIWDKLFQELMNAGHGKHIKAFAIGGLVGLKKATHQNHSHFIAPAYYCLKKYYDQGLFQSPFELHFLGVNTLIDRFVIAFLQELFNRYLKTSSINSIFTYDSIRNLMHSQYNARKPRLPYVENGQIKNCEEWDKIPEWILYRVYPDESSMSQIRNQFQLLKEGKRLDNAQIFAPINLFCHLLVDDYIVKIVQENHLIDILFGSKNLAHFFSEIENVVVPILNANPKFFGKKNFKDLKTSLGIVYEFHQCWKNDPNGLNQLVRKTIESMKLPRILRH
jgi:hypothetical protein